MGAVQQEVPQLPPMMKARFYFAGFWYAIAMAAVLFFGFSLAYIFEFYSRPPDFVALEALIGRPAAGGLTPEVVAAVEAEVGPMPVSGEDGDVPMVRAAFRTGNLGADGVRFVEWGRPVPYQHEGKWYWAVPFRYEAQAGFGRFRSDTATALVRNGGVSRYLFVPYWNFNSNSGRH